MRVGALLVDFDGTACLQDVSNLLLDRFGEPGWERYDEAVERREIGLREGVDRQAAMLGGTRDEMLEFALDHAELAPTFSPFVAWAEGRGLPVTIASDGFAFYIEPILRVAGLGHLGIVTNELEANGGPPVLRHPNRHPECVGCGTCKMLVAQGLRERHGPVAFVGEGQSDRYGALYSDVVFAKDALIRICEMDGVPFTRWETFDDVRDTLEVMETLPGPVGGERCPGWRSP
ncbi:MAG: HAD-IB family phosphatase [Actinobacteria bacterium]|nr:HAD-IB family phosphatase [Actinomycetota bacterium]